MDITGLTLPAGYTLNAAGVEIPWLRGRALRFVLVAELMARRQATVAELVTAVAEAGYELGGRASKLISDALRWEVRRGRVVRLGRGCYRYATAPASTARRIRILAHRCRAWIVAMTRGQELPPTPSDPRTTMPWLAHNPEDPPWNRLGWLWVT